VIAGRRRIFRFMDAYHCFWRSPGYNGLSHKEVFDRDEVTEIRRQADSGFYEDLVVVWGELVEFEPTEVVKTYKIAERR